jgi:hypothetical protein
MQLTIPGGKSFPISIFNCGDPINLFFLQTWTFAQWIVRAVSTLEPASMAKD